MKPKTALALLKETRAQILMPKNSETKMEVPPPVKRKPVKEQVGKPALA